MDPASLQLAAEAVNAATHELIAQIFTSIRNHKSFRTVEKMSKAESEAFITKLQIIYGYTRVEAQALNRVILYRNLCDSNYSEILEKAFPLFCSCANIGSINEDWLFYHYEKASKISQPDIQELWAKILAGEVNHPGSFSKQTLSILELISIKEAVTFEKLSSFLFYINNSPNIVFHTKNALKDLNLDFSYSDLIQIQSLGLISIDSSVFGSGYYPNFEYSSNMPINCSYFDKEFKLIPIGGVGKQPFYILNGIINLTQPGIELIRICDLHKSEKIMNYTFSCWNEYGIQVITE